MFDRYFIYMRSPRGTEQRRFLTKQEMRLALLLGWCPLDQEDRDLLQELGL